MDGISLFLLITSKLKLIGITPCPMWDVAHSQMPTSPGPSAAGSSIPEVPFIAALGQVKGKKASSLLGWGLSEGHTTTLSQGAACWSVEKLVEQLVQLCNETCTDAGNLPEGTGHTWEMQIRSGCNFSQRWTETCPSTKAVLLPMISSTFAGDKRQ